MKYIDVQFEDIVYQQIVFILMGTFVLILLREGFYV